MATTINYNIPLYDSTIDGNKFFSNFLDDISGVNSGSALNIIDSTMKDQADLISEMKNKGVYYLYGDNDGSNNYTAISTDIKEYFQGLIIMLELSATNTGPSTLKVNNFGIISLKKINNLGSKENLSAGDLLIGKLSQFRYDGIDFVMVSGGSSGGGGEPSSITVHYDESITYYISKNGNEENNGLSETTPLNNIDVIFNRLHENSGSEIYVRCGLFIEIIDDISMGFSDIRSIPGHSNSICIDLLDPDIYMNGLSIENCNCPVEIYGAPDGTINILSVNGGQPVNVYDLNIHTGTNPSYGQTYRNSFVTFENCVLGQSSNPATFVHSDIVFNTCTFLANTEPLFEATNSNILITKSDLSATNGVVNLINSNYEIIDDPRAPGNSSQPMVRAPKPVPEKVLMTDIDGLTYWGSSGGGGEPSSITVHYNESITYYISKDGNIENNGLSEATPLNNIDVIFNRLNENSGSEIYVRCNITIEILDDISMGFAEIRSTPGYDNQIFLRFRGSDAYIQALMINNCNSPVSIYGPGGVIDNFGVSGSKPVIVYNLNIHTGTNRSYGKMFEKSFIRFVGCTLGQSNMPAIIENSNITFDGCTFLANTVPLIFATNSNILLSGCDLSATDESFELINSNYEIIDPVEDPGNSGQPLVRAPKSKPNKILMTDINGLTYWGEPAAGGSSAPGLKLLTTTSDFTITSTTMSDVSQLAFTMEAGKSYKVDVVLRYRGAATTTGGKFGFYSISPGYCFITGFLEGAITSAAAATAIQVPIRVCYNKGDADSFITTTGVNSTSEDHIIHGTCYIVCEDTGVFQPCWGSGVSDSGATLMAGSMLSYQEVS